ncbi:MAG: transporter [Chloroflexi bacterium]|nr:transporter [Chloroflexota bacterium]
MPVASLDRPAAVPQSSVRVRVTLVLFTVLIALLYADQNLMAPSLTAIGGEFGFSRSEIDQRLGADVNLIFWMLGGLTTLGVGYAADRGSNRKWLLVAVALLGQSACLASGLAQTYDQLYWARALTGLGIGGSFPLVYSLLGDYFPPRRRAAAAATIGFAMGLGIAVGQFLAGMLLENHGWRAAFYLVSIPGMFFTLVYAFVAREPRRGQQEAALKDLLAAGGVYDERIRLSDIPELFKIPTNQLIFLQAIPGTIPWGMFFVYLNDFYAHDKGFSVADATLLVITVGVAAIFGGFVGGLIGQYVFNRSSHYLPLLCGLTTLIGVIPTALLISYPAEPGTPIIGPLLVAVMTGLLVAVTGPNVRSILIAVNPPERRGAVFSLFNLCDDLGKGLGAWVVGGLAATMGRVPAFHIANLMWVFCGVVLLLAVRSFHRDEQAMQAQLAQHQMEGRS